MFQPPVPITEGLDPLSLLTDDTQIAIWNNEGLPSDRMSTENATILSNSDRWPLMIDPQVRYCCFLALRKIRIVKNMWTQHIQEKNIHQTHWNVRNKLFNCKNSKCWFTVCCTRVFLLLKTKEYSFSVTDYVPRKSELLFALQEIMRKCIFSLKSIYIPKLYIISAASFMLRIYFLIFQPCSDCINPIQDL